MTSSAASGQPGEQPSAEDIQAAANAFGEGQRAQLRGEYARAAELFEIANGSAPSAEALRSAIRNRRAAGGHAQAATAALDALVRYPNDPPSVELAHEVLRELSGRLCRVQLVCAPECVATLDGRAVGRGAFGRREFFVDPGDHELRAQWPGYPPARRGIGAVAGQTREVRVERPAAPEPSPSPPATDGAAPEPSSTGEPPSPIAPPPLRDQLSLRRRGWPPLAFWIGTGLTAVTTGVAVWSGVDTLSARDQYEQEPTRARYDDGVGLELRTNVLIGASAVLGAATIAVALFAVDWGDRESPTPLVAFGPDGATFGLRGDL